MPEQGQYPGTKTSGRIAFTFAMLFFWKSKVNNWELRCDFLFYGLL